MRLNPCLALAAAASLMAFIGAANAQPPIAPPIGPNSHHRPVMPGHMGRPMIGPGQIVGNKNTKVYHLPGDKGNMPALKNRVYFRTEREAIAAGYHAAGTRRGPGAIRHPHMGLPHSMPGRMNGHLQK